MKSLIENAKIEIVEEKLNEIFAITNRQNRAEWLSGIECFAIKDKNNAVVGTINCFATSVEYILIDICEQLPEILNK